MAYKIILPGELISHKPMRGRGIIVRDGKSYATVVGAYDPERARFIPLKGIYFPQVGDTVIGLIKEDKGIGYVVDIFAPWTAFLPVRRLHTRFALGDAIAARVSAVSEIKEAQLTKGRRLSGGELLFIPPPKVPRLTGRKMSMLKTIEKITKCSLSIGQNGAVYVKGEQRSIAMVKEAMEMIDREAHIPGLTDRVQKFLTERTGK